MIRAQHGAVPAAVQPCVRMAAGGVGVSGVRVGVGISMSGSKI